IMSDFPSFDPANHRPIFQVTDKVRKLKNDPKSITVEEYRDILNEIAKSIDHSIERGLKDVIYAKGNSDPKIQSDVRAIFADLKPYSQFLIFEKSHLIACQVSEKTADDMVRAMADLQKQLIEIKY